MKHSILLVVSVADVIVLFNVSALPTCPNSSKNHSLSKTNFRKIKSGDLVDYDTKVPLSI
jgi:hypothetical protein